MLETKYKETEIGRIPEDWGIKNLQQTFDFISNNTLSRDNLTDKGLIKNIHYGDVLINYGAHVDIKKDFIPAISDPNYRASIFAKDGDVIIADTAEDDTVGKAVEVVNVGETLVVSGLHTMWLHPKDAEFFQVGYLGYAFNAALFHNQLLPLMQGTKVTSVSKTAIKDTYIVRPPKTEQSRIASSLTCIDSLISSLEKLIAKKKNIKQGTMQQLLTGKKRLKGFSEPWIEKQLGSCCSIKARIGWQGLKSDEYLEHGDYYLITSTDIINKRINWKTCYYVSKERFIQDLNIQIRKHDVLVSKDGTIGKVAFLDEIPGEGTLNSGVFVIRSKDKQLSQEYLAWIFMSMYFDDFINKIVAGSTIVHLYQKDIVNFSFMIPSSIKEQEAISSLLSSLDNEISALESKKAKYESVKQGMMQQLLTGKIRLI